MSTPTKARMYAVAGSVVLAGAALAVVAYTFKPYKPILDQIPKTVPTTSASAAPAPLFVENDGNCEWMKGERGKDCDKFTIGNRKYDLGIEDVKGTERYSDVDKKVEEMVNGTAKAPYPPVIAIVHVGEKGNDGQYHPVLVPAKVVWVQSLPGDNRLKSSHDSLNREGVQVIYNPEGTDTCINSMRYEVDLYSGELKLNGPSHPKEEEDNSLPNCATLSWSNRSSSFRVEAVQKVEAVAIKALRETLDLSRYQPNKEGHRDFSFTFKLDKSGALIPLTGSYICPKDESCSNMNVLPLVKSRLSKLSLGSGDECLLTTTVRLSSEADAASPVNKGK
jgi:hypothetical protein